MRAVALGVVAAIWWGGPAGPTARGEDRPPNLVLILADDLGWADIGVNGRAEWETPHLDRLASRGATLRRFYAAASVCGPSRSALLTGKTPARCGVRTNVDDLPASEVTIAEALEPAGYATGLFGKWHGGRLAGGAATHPLDQGFGAFFGFVDPFHAAQKFPETLWDGRGRVAVRGYADDLFTDRAVAYIEEHADRPFLLVLSLTAPHFDVEAPPEEVERHRGRLAEADPDRPHNARYAAMVTRLDRHVGQVVGALDRLGLTERTLVVFASDHGATFEANNCGASAALNSNGPLRGQKRTLWEGGIRVPAIASWPGRIPAGASLDEPGSLIDLLPTFLAAAGLDPDPAWRVEGVDLLPHWTRGRPIPDRALFWEWQDEGSDQLAAMRGDLKLVVNRGGPPELYDLAADPSECRDLAAGRPGEADGLLEQLLAWQSSAPPPPADRHAGSGAAGRGPGARPSIAARAASLFRPRWLAAPPDDPPGEPEPTGDLALLQGRWEARAGDRGQLDVELEIAGTRASVRVTSPEGITLRASGSLRLVESSGPPALDWVDFTLRSGPRLPTIPSIYRLDGETLTLCGAGPSGERPEAFVPGDGVLADVVTFRRVDARGPGRPVASLR